MLHRHQVVETYFCCCGSHQLARIPRFSFDLLATFFCEIFFLLAETHRWTRLYVGIAALFFLATFGRFHFIFFLCKRSGQQRRGEKNNSNNNLEEKKRNNEIPIAGWKESRISGLDESSRTHVTPHSLSLSLSISFDSNSPLESLISLIATRCWPHIIIIDKILFEINFFFIGLIFLKLGFYSEFPSIEIALNFNQTVFLVDPESQKRRVKSSYSYIGPVLIGIGGKFKMYFILKKWTRNM